MQAPRLHILLGKVKPWQIMLGSVIVSVTLSGLSSYLIRGTLELTSPLIGLVVSSVVAPLATWVLYSYRNALEAANTRLATSNAALEAQVQERTAALGMACWEADAASRLKGAFLSTISHELRTPMNGVLLALELMADAEGEARRELNQLAMTAAQQMQQLVEDVLDLSRLEEGGLVMAEEPFALGPVLERTADLKKPEAESRGLTLLTDIAETLPPSLIGDGIRLQQVMFNLLDNAIKFTESGSVRFIVAHTPAGVGVEHITITVSDTGVGIPADRLGQIFDRFTQVDGSTTRRYGGAGIGLALCRHLIEQMGGRIDVESQPGRGSTFTVQLRLRHTAAVRLIG